jgi:mono/diheme cytochrome c family protein
VKTLNKTVAIAACALGLTATAALAADAAAGKAVYTAKCQNCHSADGTGNPKLAPVLKVEFKPLGGFTDAEVKTAVTAGFGKMKPVASVTGADLDNVIAYVHTLKK